jgi:hypothetical protein
MPSMHLGWALLLALNARSRWLAAALWAYAALIALATIGLGQHYVVDLIAAIPYTVTMQWMTKLGTYRRIDWARLKNRWRPRHEQWVSSDISDSGLKS